MNIYILFGLPGAGKTYIGKVFAKEFGYHFYEGDNDLTDEMNEAMQTKTVFTDVMRDVFFKNLIRNIQKLSKDHKKIVVAQTFIKEKYRKMLLESLPEAKFIYIHADDAIREQRLFNRVEYPLDIAYARIMKQNFEIPNIPHKKIMNTEQGSEKLTAKIQVLLAN